MMGKIGFIGAGQMAEALIKSLVGNGLVEPAEIIAGDVNNNRLNYLSSEYEINTSIDNKDVVEEAEIIFLSVKPQVMKGVLLNIATSITADQLVVSIAAGITTKLLEEYLRMNVPVIRLMPNTACLVGEGMTAGCLGRNATEDHVAKVKIMVETMGKFVRVEEGLMDSVTGLSGSGPAFAYLLMEALADGGVMVGFSRETAVLLAAQSMLGAAKMVLETELHTGKLRDMVTSPGGTAIAGIYELESGQVRKALMRAVMTATQRSRQLGGSDDDPFYHLS